MSVLYDTCIGDHVPFITDISLDLIPITILRWDNLIMYDIERYTMYTDTLLQNVNLHVEALSCKDVKFRIESHTDNLNIFL